MLTRTGVAGVAGSESEMAGLSSGFKAAAGPPVSQLYLLQSGRYDQRNP